MGTVERGGEVRGVVLAAGAGRRMGRPKILVEDWLERAVRALAANGLPVTVVVGADPTAAHERVQAVVGALGVPVETVEAADWDEGMGASLRAALTTAAGTAVLVTLVDLPDVGEAVVARLLEGPVDAGTLRRAAYAGKPGHPVLLGRDHHVGVVASARGDRGARAYLDQRAVELVECGDLASGEDVDSLSGPSGS